MNVKKENQIVKEEVNNVKQYLSFSCILINVEISILFLWLMVDTYKFSKICKNFTLYFIKLNKLISKNNKNYFISIIES
jgi:hypothetical protein